MSLLETEAPPSPPAVAAETFDPPIRGLRLAGSAMTWLIRDTFRQAMASKLMLLAVCLTGLGILACLSVRVQGPRTLKPAGEIELYDAQNRPITAPGSAVGRMTVGFGAVTVGNFRGVEPQVRFLQAMIARWAAGVAGTIILLTATAGFLPDFLRPAASSVLLAKPVPRWALMAGKAGGVLAFVASLSGVFIVGTWLALGVRTGVWAPGYLLAWPLLVAQFAGLYAVSAVAASCTRNTAASLFAALACWMACLGANGAHESLQASAGTMTQSPVARVAVEAAYWALPKPVDFSRMLDRAVSASDHFAGAEGLSMNLKTVAGSVGSSMAFALVMLAIAARQLQTTDY